MKSHQFFCIKHFFKNLEKVSFEGDIHLFLKQLWKLCEKIELFLNLILSLNNFKLFFSFPLRSSLGSWFLFLFDHVCLLVLLDSLTGTRMEPFPPSHPLLLNILILEMIVHVDIQRSISGAQLWLGQRLRWQPFLLGDNFVKGKLNIKNSTLISKWYMVIFWMAYSI